MAQDQTLHTMGFEVARLSRWLDEAQGDRNPEAITWGRIAKVGEEFGEVVEAFIGATGQNPRKGVTHSMNDVIKENLDVAVTALGNVEHLTGNEGGSLFRLLVHLGRVVERAEQAGMP